ncbi:MAG: hypothetical protein R3C20_06395 [Planctomycetaceae bacterium]
MSTPRQRLVLPAIAVIAAAFFAFHVVAADTEPLPRLTSRAYSIKDLPIYRLSPQGQYVTDASAVAMLCRSAIGHTPGFNAKVMQTDCITTLVVRATDEAHDAFINTLAGLRESARLHEASHSSPESPDSNR